MLFTARTERPVRRGRKALRVQTALMVRMAQTEKPFYMLPMILTQPRELTVISSSIQQPIRYSGQKLPVPGRPERALWAHKARQARRARRVERLLCRMQQHKPK